MRVVQRSRAAETFWLAIGAAALGCASVDQPARHQAIENTPEVIPPDASADAEPVEPVVDAGREVTDAGSMVPIYGSTEIVIITTVEFSPSSAQISADDRKKVEELAHIFKEQPEIEVAVEGHVDLSEATGKAAEDLSRRRAEAVRRALVKAGVPKDRLTIDAQGAIQRPTQAPDEARERYHSRRVLFRVTKQPPPR